MNIKLKPNTKLWLIEFNTYSERLAFLDNEVLSKLIDYIGKDDTRKKGLYIERLDNLFDIMAEYLISTPEYSVKIQKKRYCELIKKENKTVDEIQEFNKLKKNVLYYKAFKKRECKHELVFYVNTKIEQLLFKNIGNYLSQEKLGYTEQFMLKNSITRLNICRNNKEKCKLYRKQIDEYQQRLLSIQRDICQRYGELKQNKDSIMEIVKLAEELQNTKEEIVYIEKQIEYLYDEYVLATEIF